VDLEESDRLRRGEDVAALIAKGERLTEDLTKAEQQLSVSVALNTRLTQVCMSEDKYPEFNEAFRRSIVTNIVSAVNDALAKRDVPLELYIGELAHIRVGPRNVNELGQISGMERGSPAATRRILQNGVIRACEQLPVDVAGVVFVYSKVLPDPQFFRLFFDAICSAERDTLSKLVAVVLCPMQTVFHTSPSTIFTNAQTRFPTLLPKVLEVLTLRFGSTVVPFD